MTGHHALLQRDLDVDDSEQGTRSVYAQHP